MRTKGKWWWKRRNSNPRPCVTGRRSNQLNYDRRYDDSPQLFESHLARILVSF